MTMTQQDRDTLLAKPLTEKVEYGKETVRQALDKAQKPVVLYTGGKDSTVVLWMVHQVVSNPSDVPTMILDHGLHFAETWELVNKVKEDLNLELLIARNENVLKHAGEHNAPIDIASLDEENKKEIRENLNYHEATFPYSLDTEVGNHLLKTVALRQALRQHGFDYAFVGIRWDEHPARAEEKFFSPRSEPNHTRVHPILPLTEQDIWDVMRGENLPTHPLYEQGFRSLDSVGAEKSDDRPAWEQQLGVGERAGREQDKEEIMGRLRALGYM